MKPRRWQGLLSGLCAGVLATALAQSPARVVGDRVNVRSRPSLGTGEVLTQLTAGQRVLVFEEGLPPRHAREPVSDWTRIELPAGTPIWVSAAHLAPATGTVTARRLNLRAGPSEDYAVLGVVPQGTVLRVQRQIPDWIQVEAPLGLSGFVASRFLDVEVEPAAASSPATSPPSPPSSPDLPVPARALASPTVTGQTPPPAEAADHAADLTFVPEPEPPALRPLIERPTALDPLPPAPAAAAGDTAAELAPAPVPEDVMEPVLPERRVVRREGIVAGTLSIQAPSPFELRAADTGRLLNYLLPEADHIEIRLFRGQRVLVLGEEYLESRWPTTPLILVEAIKLAP